MEHDRTGGSAEGIDSHSDEFLGVLGRMISDEYKLSAAKSSARKAYDARVSFFDQFTTHYQLLEYTKTIGKIAAGAMLLAYLGSAIQDTEQEKYAKFLASLTPQEKVFYLQTERWLLDRFEETKDPRYLKNVGRFKALEDVWGQGP